MDIPPAKVFPQPDGIARPIKKPLRKNRSGFENP